MIKFLAPPPPDPDPLGWVKGQIFKFRNYSVINSLTERGSCMVLAINMGVCSRLDFDNIMLFNCLGYNFNIYGAFEFLCNFIANL